MKDKIVLLLIVVLISIMGLGASINHTPKGVTRDASTNASIIIEYEHHEIHGSSHYTLSQCDQDLDSGEVIELLLTTPDSTKEIHMLLSLIGQLTTTAALYENCTHTANTTVTAYNNNRNSTNTATAVISTHNDDGVDGTKILETCFGIATGGGADNNRITQALSWYEHTPKN